MINSIYTKTDRVRKGMTKGTLLNLSAIDGYESSLRLTDDLKSVEPFSFYHRDSLQPQWSLSSSSDSLILDMVYPPVLDIAFKMGGFIAGVYVSDVLQILGSTIRTRVCDDSVTVYLPVVKIRPFLREINIASDNTLVAVRDHDRVIINIRASELIELGREDNFTGYLNKIIIELVDWKTPSEVLHSIDVGIYQCMHNGSAIMMTEECAFELINQTVVAQPSRINPRYACRLATCSHEMGFKIILPTTPGYVIASRESVLSDILQMLAHLRTGFDPPDTYLPGLDALARFEELTSKPAPLTEEFSVLDTSGPVVGWNILKFVNNFIVKIGLARAIDDVEKLSSMCGEDMVSPAFKSLTQLRSNMRKKLSKRVKEATAKLPPVQESFKPCV